nr:DDE-type integrase/transposase/recombinase [Rhodococcus qingshengii]
MHLARTDRSLGGREFQQRAELNEPCTCSIATSPLKLRTAHGLPFSLIAERGGFVYVAFVIDCFSREIIGWHASTVKDTAVVTTALKMALWRRDHGGHKIGDGLIHHSETGSRYTSIPSRKHLRWKVLHPRWKLGDDYDNAIAE